MNITFESVCLNAYGFRVLNGSLVPWSDLDRILEALPAVAHERLGWFSIMAPPSHCGMATDEVKAILAALFQKKAVDGPVDGPAAGVDQ